jgi:large subunit ribosomal protein L4
MPKVKEIKNIEEVAATVEAPKVVKAKKVADKANLKADVYNLKGEVSGKFELPEELFGAKINKALLSQAIRVYQNNQAGHHGHTKTRGEVSISTRKIYKQKGTGGARHGAKSAPIFVGGGVAFGPRDRKVVLDLPKKMQKAALISALSSKVLESQVCVIDGLETANGKTKQMAELFAKLGTKKMCLVAAQTKDEMANVFRASANLKGITFEIADNLSVLKVLHTDKLFFTSDAITKLVGRVAKKETN